MKKTVRSPGSATIINAIAIGFGSAFGIGLDIKCEAKTMSEGIQCENDVGADTNLMDLCVERVFNHYDISKDELDCLVEKTKGFSYADLEASIKEVAQLFILNENFRVDFEIIKKSIESIVPYEKSYPEFVENCRKWGQERAVQASKEGE